MGSHDAHSARSFGGFILSPIGGGIISLLLFPTGCDRDLPGFGEPQEILSPCPSGQETDFLGLTLGGLVGTVDAAGAVVIGFVFALAFYGIAAFMDSKS
jgi:hypothetical protein